MSGVGEPVAPGGTFSWAAVIGYYVNIYEIDAANHLVNQCHVQVDNSILCSPAPGATAIAGGAGKATVSNYSAVTGCKLYLVPENLYPVGYGAINLGSVGVREITANGDISGLSAGKYKLFTVYTGSYPFPIHGAYAAGTEVMVTTGAGIESVETPVVSVFSQNGNLIIESKTLAIATVSIYGISGQLLRSVESGNNQVVIGNLPKQQILIVKVVMSDGKTITRKINL